MSTWILLRGLTRECRHWGDFPETLQRECSGATVCCIDLPGNGSLHAQASPPQVLAMAEHCRTQLGERGIDPPYFLLAMSLGAMVAIDWANRHPAELAGCVLINTSLRPFSPFYHRLRPRNYPSLLPMLLGQGDASCREKTILRLTSSQPERPEKQAEWAVYARQNPVSPGNAWRQLLAAARYRAPLHKPAPPMLVLGSAQDSLVNPACSRQLARLWNVAFAEHPTAGHDLPLDDGAWVASQIRCWHEKLSRTA
ncbi:hydrolase [Dechloromonas denitrificans]|uniref:Hydrolase n=1 Tax=Dechloromonas denitrificans TaxID=281362 RepID=A0A133XIE8_9RHOO|nr:alpha/beta hydrolase [Dechloromonas denitrificans]KXB30702.1 hydrolase [Dechloromonas denitrificans]